MTVSKEQLLANLANMPAAMRERRQWLVWRLMPARTEGGKPAKVPFYANGFARGWPHGKPKDGTPTDAQPKVAQGDELDRAALVSFDEAVAVVRARGSWAGVGFAFLPGDGLIGVDIDHAIDADTGEVSDLCQTVLALCPSYAEWSVSGTGLHIILTGHVDKFKDDLIGLEVYCDSQFFTCTGRAWGGAPLTVEPVRSYAVTAMRAMVEKSLAEQKAARDAEAAAAAPPPAVQKPALAVVGGTAAPKPAKAKGSTKGEKGDDFQRVNAAALANLSSWVPVLFPGAKVHASPKGNGYRVSSESLGRSMQEDLTLTPEGIRDFGPDVITHGRPGQAMSAIDCVVQWRGGSLHDALQWLAPLVGVSLAKPKRASGAGSSLRPEPPPTGEKRASEAAGRGDAGESDGDGGDDDGADHSALEGGSGGAKGSKAKKVDPAKLDALFGGYAYQYGSDIAWSLSKLKAVKIMNLRNTYGNDAVKIWMNHSTRRMVEEEHVVFEPGKELGGDYINLYTGLALKPAKTADCQPMLDLLQWLCAQSEADGPDGKLDGKDIADWVLRWVAIQVQRPGTKMQSALVFHGPMGTGKNLFFDVVRDFFGEYGVMVGQGELDDKFNTWLSRRMFIVADEVMSRAEIYHSKNKLKWIITQKTKIPIRAMHMDVRFESNYVNLAFLSNEDQPLALEEGDRRMLVVYTPRKDYDGLYERVRAFLADGGAAKFLKHLLTLPLSDFEEGTEPPLTKAKRDLIELGYHASERFVVEWLEGYLELPKCVCSVEQLYTVYMRWATAAGERFTGSQAQFTSKVKAFVHKRVEFDDAGKPLDPALEYRIFTCPDPTRGRKTIRCWVPRGCGPRDDLVGIGEGGDDSKPYRTQGDWAASCMEDFDKVARGFMRRFHSTEDSDAS